MLPWRSGWRLAVGLDWLDRQLAWSVPFSVALSAKNLIVQSGRVLLDREMITRLLPKSARSSAALPSPATRRSPTWCTRVGSGAYACAIGLLTHDPALTPLHIRKALGIHEEIATSR